MLTVPHLAFYANCGSDRLDVAGGSAAGVQIRYVCTWATTVEGIMLGEADFLAGAKIRVEQMIEQAKLRARGRSQS